MARKSDGRLTQRGWHGKRYYRCVVCLNVMRVPRIGVVAEHCGKLMKFLTDVEARELIEGRKKGQRMKAKVASFVAGAGWPRRMR